MNMSDETELTVTLRIVVPTDELGQLDGEDGIRRAIVRAASDALDAGDGFRVVEEVGVR